MGRVDPEPTRTVTPGLRGSPGRSEGPGKRAGRTAVQRAIGLSVAFDRHRAYDTLCRRPVIPDAHPGGQRVWVRLVRLVRLATVDPVGHRRRHLRLHCRRLPVPNRCSQGRLHEPAPAGGQHGAARTPSSARRALARLPGLLRPPAGEFLDHDGAADERRIRVHGDADQRPAR